MDKNCQGTMTYHENRPLANNERALNTDKSLRFGNKALGFGRYWISYCK